MKNLTSKQLLQRLFTLADREGIESAQVGRLTLGQLALIQALLKEANK